MKISRFLILSSSVIFLPQVSTAQQIVDSELLLLVDVSGSVNSSEYNLMMGGYEAAFRSSDVYDAIAAGLNGKIAVSVAMWSGNAQQQVVVPWTLVSDSVSSNAFADALALVTRPFSGSTAIADGMNFGVPLFGTETGGSENGFTSVAQIMDISGDGQDNNSTGIGSSNQKVATARDAAIAAGVDMINGLPIGGGDTGNLSVFQDYYTNNVIAGSVGPVSSFIQPTASFGDVQSALESKLQSEITIGALKSVGAIPEPSSALLIVLGGCGLLGARRR